MMGPAVFFQLFRPQAYPAHASSKLCEFIPFIAAIAAIAAIATNVAIWAQILSAYWVGRFRRAGCILQDTYLLYKV